MHKDSEISVLIMMESVQHIIFTRHSYTCTSVITNFGKKTNNFKQSDIFCSPNLDIITFDEIVCRTWLLSSRAVRTHTNFGFVWEISRMFTIASSYSSVRVVFSLIRLIKSNVYA